MKYRKLPVVIEALQMTKERRANMDWPKWLHDAWNLPHSARNSLSCVDHPNSDGTDPLEIHTLEGHHLVSWDDYIIKGVQGELYPCKPDIFNATYEKVED